MNGEVPWFVVEEIAAWESQEAAESPFRLG